MSNQSNSSVYSEKKIAAYEGMFRESSFAKPQEVYLTVTVAHLFGQAYIMEQEGTKEGDPIYSRFVCPLEEITKVYINENAKSSPLFIQCDTDVKGVIHRKRIIVPCLDNVAAIVRQINEVREARMEKVNAALEREKQKKLHALEEQRKAEQAAMQANSAIPPLAAVEKLPESPKATEASVTPIKTTVKTVNIPVPAAEKAKDIKELNNEIAESMKALEGFEKTFSSSAAKAPASRKPPLNLDDIPDKVESTPAPKKEIKTVVAEKKPEAVVSKPASNPAPTPVQPVKPVQPVQSAQPVQPAQPVRTAPAVTAPKVNPVGKPSSLADFEAKVKNLKALKDSGQISAEEYKAQRKSLVAELY